MKIFNFIKNFKRNSETNEQVSIETTDEVTEQRTNIQEDKNENHPDGKYLKNVEFYEKAICPYCNFQLEKAPSRKKKCNNCNNYIYVRTNYINKEKMLLTESDISKLDNIREEYYDSNNRRILKRFYNDKDFIKLKKQKPNIKDYDIIWSLLSKRIHESIAKGDWQKCKINLFNQYLVLNEEGKYERSLYIYLMYLYYNINSRYHFINTEIELGNKTEDDYIWEDEIENIKSLMSLCNYNLEKVKELFYKNKTVAIPEKNLTVEEIWEIINRNII